MFTVQMKKMCLFKAYFKKAEFKEIGKFVNIGLKDSFTNMLNIWKNICEGCVLSS